MYIYINIYIYKYIYIYIYIYVHTHTLGIPAVLPGRMVSVIPVTATPPTTLTSYDLGGNRSQLLLPNGDPRLLCSWCSTLQATISD